MEFDRQHTRARLREHLKGSYGAEGMLSARFAIGVAIISLGALFLLDSLGWIESRYVLRKVWPLILVFIGVAMLSKGRPGRRRNEGWAFIVVGLWIFISKIGLLDFSFWGILFPLVLLFVGGMLVYRALKPPGLQVTFDPADAPKPDPSGATEFSTGPATTSSGFTRQSGEEEHAEYIRTFAMLSGSEMRPMSRPFRGADLTAVLAGIKLDLTSARMEGDTVRIDVFAFCGGIDVHVPPDWTVTSKVATLMGAYTDKRRPTTTLPTKTLIIDGFAVMGGIEVKN